MDVAEWKTEFLRPEAKEVVEAVGAWLYFFRLPKSGDISPACEKTMRAIQEVTEKHAGYAGDTVMLAVGMPASNKRNSETQQEEWDDLSMQYGFEFVEHAADGSNQFGEKVGKDRLREALEANEWTAEAASEEDEFDLQRLGLDGEDGDDLDGISRDEAEMTAELFGLKSALAGDTFEPEIDDLIPPRDEADEVETMDRLMGRLLAVKDQSAGLPEVQRKKMAAKAVKELLNESEPH